MPFVQAKCSNCGGTLSVDDSLGAAVCPFCNTPYVVEKAINNYNISNTVNVGSGAVVNIIGEQKSDFEIEAGELKGYKGINTDVTIPDNVKKIGFRAFFNKGITSVVVPSSVEVIGKEAFACCGDLKEVVFAEGLKEIGSLAFTNCIRIREIKLPSTVTNIGEGGFGGCSELECVSLQNGLKKIGNVAFAKCISLKELNIPTTVQTIGEKTFLGCESLVSVNLSCGISEIGESTFENCKSLVEVVFPKNLQAIRKKAFKKCSSLKKIELPNSVKAIHMEAFCNCIGLEYIELGSGLEELYEEVFWGCTSLKKVEIPSGVKHLLRGVFSQCTSLEEVRFNEGLEIIGATPSIHNFSKLEPLRASLEYEYGVFMDCAIKELVIPASVTDIGGRAFLNCKLLESVTFKNRDVWIDFTAFNGCKFVPDVPNFEGKPKKEGCYIATSVYGSYDCPQVWTLRRYRDYSLYNSLGGRLFIKFYYKISPTLVKYFGNSRLFKCFWRKYLDSLVSSLRHKGYENTPYSDRDY